MPSVASVDALHRAATEFGVTDLGLVIEPGTLAAARRSLDSSGLLLLGETHGVRENPLLIRALMLELILFDGVTGADWSWSQRDEAMARRILVASPPGARTLAVAGNAHTPTRPIQVGVPMGARLAEQRPAIREIRIRYGAGYYWNFKSRQFTRHPNSHGDIRLHQHSGGIVLDLPLATEAVVPQRAQPGPPALA